MLDIIPNAEQMTALVGKPLYEIWEKLCALIDERYAMEAAWNRGGKAWTYLLAGVLRNVYHAINPVPFPHRIQLLRFVGIGRLRCGAGWRRGSLCRRRLAGRRRCAGRIRPGGLRIRKAAQGNPYRCAKQQERDPALHIGTCLLSEWSTVYRRCIPSALMRFADFRRNSTGRLAARRGDFSNTVAVLESPSAAGAMRRLIPR